jgi:N-acetyl-anhydromuramyl-L-alanine amidase AmpD
MLKIIDKKLNNSFGEEKNKKQIILTHTSRNIEEYLTSLKYRNHGKYDKIPHYVISKDGDVIQTLDDEKYTKYIGQPTFDKQSIIVSFENLGWLEKEPLKNHHINWLGSIYKEKVFDRKWRDFFFWEPYTKKQLEKAAILCKTLCEKHSIEKTCLGHNTKINRMETFKGILTRSNIDEDVTDVSPAFDFEYFIKKLEI